MTSTDPLVGDYLIARQKRDEAQAELDEVQERLIKTMEADQRKSYRWQTTDHAYTVTYVQKRTPVIDEVGLRKALKAKTFDRYTKRVLDKRAMEAAMDAGEIDPVVVSRFVTMKPSRAYLEYRERDAPTTNTAEEI